MTINKKLTLTLAATGMLAAACGGGGAPGTGSDNGIKGKDIAAIESQVNQAVSSSKTFTATGQGTTSGQQAKVDLQVNFPSKQVKGTITLQAGGQMTVIMVNDHVYATLDKAIAEQFGGGPQADALAGKCIDFGSASDSNNPFGSSGLGTFSNGDLFAGSTWTKGSVKTVNGVETLALTSNDGTEVDVATHGDALPVQLTTTSSASPSPGATASNDTTSLSFTNWGGSVSVSQPSDCQTIAQLEQALLSGGLPTDTSGATPTPS